MKQLFGQPLDERKQSNARLAAAIWLGVTQVLLAAVIFFRLYVLGQPDGEIRDFQAVLAVSIFGYIGLQLLIGGVFPVPSRKGLVIAYLALAGLVTVVSLAVHGLPPLADWKNTWLPALTGPAMIVGLYCLVAVLGQRRLERQIEGD